MSLLTKTFKDLCDLNTSPQPSPDFISYPTLLLNSFNHTRIYAIPQICPAHHSLMTCVFLSPFPEHFFLHRVVLLIAPPTAGLYSKITHLWHFPELPHIKLHLCSSLFDLDFFFMPLITTGHIIYLSLVHCLSFTTQNQARTLFTVDSPLPNSV